MRRYIALLSALPFIAALAACAPTREEADDNLGKACVESLRATFTDEKEHFEAQDIVYAFKNSYDGVRLRIVTVEGHYTYGESEPYPKTYTCTYTEDWTFFSYIPAFYNLERDGQKFGNVNGSIVGDAATLLRINEAAAKHLR